MDEHPRRPATPPNCAFCRIVAGTAPAHIVLDDGVAVAFLDVRPVFKGHVLLVPRDLLPRWRPAHAG